MNVLILQLDGKVPNIALMRVSAHHRALTRTCLWQELLRVVSLDEIQTEKGDNQ
jgi:hypothetical protein